MVAVWQYPWSRQLIVLNALRSSVVGKRRNTRSGSMCLRTSRFLYKILTSLRPFLFPWEWFYTMWVRILLEFMLIGFAICCKNSICLMSILSELLNLLSLYPNWIGSWPFWDQSWSIFRIITIFRFACSRCLAYSGTDSGCHWPWWEVTSRDEGGKCIGGFNIAIPMWRCHVLIT